MMIPKKAKFKGLVVRAPAVHPGLTPLVDHRGITVGFYTNAINTNLNRSFTPSLTPRIDTNLGAKRNNTDRESRYRLYDEV